MTRYFLILHLFTCLAAAGTHDTTPASHLASGMRLQGKTRVSENRLINFNLKILSILKGSAPGEDSILAEIEDEFFKENGVLAGMSGSPVYISNTLVGAVAYTSDFLKKPIVGITPIDTMLRVLSYDKIKRSRKYEQGRKFYGLSSITTPLAVSGNFMIPERFLTKLLFTSERFVLVPGSVDRSKDAPTNFVPGDACGVNLVRGDLTLSAFGTVTYVSNDYVLAFGHPIGLFGKVDLPLYTASIDAVVPKLTISYKVGTLRREVGRITEDRSTAALGRLGKFASRIPLTVKLNTELQKRTFHYEVVKEPRYFSGLTALLILNSFFHYESVAEQSSLLYKLKIYTDFQKQAIDIFDMYTGEQNLEALSGLVGSLRNILNFVEQNPFLPINIKKIELELDLKNEVSYLYITDLWTTKKEYTAGDTVKLKVEFTGYKTGKTVKDFTFKLPGHVTPGTYPLIASSGYYFLLTDMFTNPARYMVTEPDSMFRLLNNTLDAQTFCLWMFVEQQGLMVKGKEYKKLPVVPRNLLSSSYTKQRADVLEFKRTDHKLGKPVIGAGSSDIRIVHKKFKTIK